MVARPAYSIAADEIETAQRAVQHGKLIEAESILNKYIDSGTAKGRAYMMLAAIKMRNKERNGEVASARKLLITAIKKSTDSEVMGESNYLLAKISFDFDHDLPGALGFVRSALNAQNGDAEYHFFLGRINMLLGNHLEAADNLQRYLELDREVANRPVLRRWIAAMRKPAEVPVSELYDAIDFALRSIGLDVVESDFDKATHIATGNFRGFEVTLFIQVQKDNAHRNVMYHYLQVKGQKDSALLLDYLMPQLIEKINNETYLFPTPKEATSPALRALIAGYSPPKNTNEPETRALPHARYYYNAGYGIMGSGWHIEFWLDYENRWKYNLTRFVQDAWQEQPFGSLEQKRFFLGAGKVDDQRGKFKNISYRLGQRISISILYDIERIAEDDLNSLHVDSNYMQLTPPWGVLLITDAQKAGVTAIPLIRLDDHEGRNQVLRMTLESQYGDQEAEVQAKLGSLASGAGR